LRPLFGKYTSQGSKYIKSLIENVATKEMRDQYEINKSFCKPEGMQKNDSYSDIKIINGKHQKDL